MKITLVPNEPIRPPQYSLAQVKTRKGWYKWVYDRGESVWRLYSDGCGNLISFNSGINNISYLGADWGAITDTFEEVTGEKYIIEY